MCVKSLEKKSRRGWLKESFATAVVAAAVAFGAPAQANDTIKIGFSMALTGGLAGAGKGALIAMQVWAEDTNANGGLLGKQVELVYYDDQTNPATVPAIYTKLLDIDKVDFVVSGYGTNLIAPAMPIVMQRGLVFPSLFGLAVNEKFNYPNYFQIMPSGPSPMTDWSRGFFDVAMAQDPPPKTIALVGADAEFAPQCSQGRPGRTRRIWDSISSTTSPIRPRRRTSPRSSTRFRRANRISCTSAPIRPIRSGW